MRRTQLLVAALVPVVAAVAAVTSAATAPTGQAQAAGVPGSPIKHVIEIMIENHSFDNLFGSFPGADGIPANASFLNPSAYYDSAPNVSPVQATPNEGDVQGAINNSRVAEQMAMDYVPGKGYQMDHYTTFPQDGMSAITEFGPSFDPDEQYLASQLRAGRPQLPAAHRPDAAQRDDRTQRHGARLVLQQPGAGRHASRGTRSSTS